MEEANDPIVYRKIGLKTLKMRESHKLPEYYSMYPLYDRALPRIAARIESIDGKLRFIDIGANIGDTVALVTDVVDGDFLCIEGDKDFLPFLEENVKLSPNSRVTIERAFASEQDDKSSSLVVDRGYGTAKLIKSTEEKNDTTQSKKLDTMVHDHISFKDANMLKIDTDGFETEILRGASEFLASAAPMIFFEFTPSAFVENGNDPLEVFRLLQKNGYKEALFYDNFGKPREIVSLADEEKIAQLVEKIDRNAIYYYDVLTWKENTDKKYRSIVEGELFSVMGIFEAEKQQLMSDLEQSKQLPTEATPGQFTPVTVQETIVIEPVRQEPATTQPIQKIFRWSRSDLVEALFPSGTWRRNLSWRTITAAKYAVSQIKQVYKGVRYNTKRKINQRSRKLVLVDHSYHGKTKSNDFMINYLQAFFDVEIAIDESWQGKPFVDLSFIDDTYHGVVFWQSIPSPQVVNALATENRIFFPMYDNLGRNPDPNYWRQYKLLKVINFSKAGHEFFESIGMDSLYVQYFPEPQEFLEGAENEVFFWQRMTSINIDTVARLLEKTPAKIHFHRAIDPGHTVAKPTPEQERTFSITYSDWFDTREEMMGVLQEKSIYVAPREMEGIGLGFLEAMAMGKAVIAADSPTMNEYITSGVTGYLFPINLPTALDLSNLRKVQRNTYAYMQQGYTRWSQDREKIISFIKKP